MASNSSPVVESAGGLALESRARGCLLGLAVGDALGGPTENKSREAIARLFGRVTDFQTPDQSGSDDTEYALFIARVLMKYGSRFSAEMVAEEWKLHIVAGSNAHKGAGFSEMLAIRNLKDGLMPPASGMHAHAWSDGLAMRVAPFGIVAAGYPELAAKLAGMDGSVTHTGEGIFSGQAVAAAVASAMGGNALTEIMDAAQRVVPADSWTGRALARAVAIGTGSATVHDALAPLYDEIACTYYPWSDLAPEAIGLAFGVIAASRGDFREAVLGGVNVGRDTDTIAGIAGAITGAMNGADAIPREWTGRVNISRGTCLASVRGMRIDETADALAALARRGEFLDYAGQNTPTPARVPRSGDATEQGRERR